jgi:hypothetical protein
MARNSKSACATDRKAVQLKAEAKLAIETKYTSSRARNGAYVPAEETMHLLRSPKNAKRLLTALRRANRRIVKPESVVQLRHALGLERAG